MFALKTEKSQLQTYNVRQKKNTNEKKKCINLKQRKYTVTIEKPPLGVHLVMPTGSEFCAHIAADPKNKMLGFKYGSKLLKVNGLKVESFAFEDILKTILKAKYPMELQCREVLYALFVCLIFFFVLFFF